MDPNFSLPIRKFFLAFLALLASFACLGLLNATEAHAASSYTVAVCDSNSPSGGVGIASGLDSLSYPWVVNSCSNPTGSFSAQTEATSGSVAQGFVSVPILFSAPSGESISGFSISGYQFYVPGNMPWNIGLVGWEGSYNQEFDSVPACERNGGSGIGNGSYWVAGGAGDSDQNYCATSGGAVTVNGSSYGQSYSWVGLMISCEVNGGCSNDSGIVGAISGFSATINDPNSNASVGTAGGIGNDLNTGKWYSGAAIDSGAPEATATDPGGICYLSPTLINSSGTTISPSTYSGSNPSVLNDNGYFSGGQFTAPTCSNPSGSTYLYTNELTALPSGSYTYNVQAQNPAQYAAGAAVPSDSTFLYGSTASDGEQLNLDNVSPTAAWNSTSTAYSNHTAEELTATVGSSGIGTVTCTDNGSSVTPVALGSNPSGGAGTYNYNVPTTAQGANAMSCVVANGDTGTALTATTTPQTFNVDTTTPTVTVPAANSSWISSPASLAVGTTSGPSGIASLTCSNSLNNDIYTVDGGLGTIPASDNSNGVNTWTCQATSGAGLASALATVTEKLDSSSPSGSLSGDSAGTWYSTAIPLNFTSTVGVSGLRSVACSNSNNSNTYSESASTSGTIPASDETNGTNNWTCVVTDNAGSTTDFFATEQLDTTTPTVSVPTSNTSWVSSSTSLAVGGSDSVSGIASITCSDSNNSNVYVVNASSGAIPTSDETNGVNTWTCYSTNNAGTNSANATVIQKVDSVEPTITFDTTASQTSSYALISDIPPIKVDGTLGPSGLSAFTCSGDGVNESFSSPTSNLLNLSNLKTGSGSVTCELRSNSGLTSSSSFDLTVGATNADNVAGNANIQGSVLAISGPTAVSFSGELDGSDLNLTDSAPADQSLVATDATGSFSGWNISAQVNGQFTDGGGATLPSTALSLNSSTTSSTIANGPSDSCVTNSTCTVSTDPNVAYPVAIPTSTSSGATVYDAGVNTGMGSMGVQPLDWWLAVPGNALAGIYATTLTLSINSGPTS